MLRTIRAAVAVMLLGGIALTVPPQTRDMLAALDDDHVWSAISFQIALMVLSGSAWFWSRAALAARFGIEDGQRSGPADSNIDWTAFVWLPRLVLLGSSVVGAVVALRSSGWWTTAGAIALAALAFALTIFRRRGQAVANPPAPRNGFRAWVRGGARARLRALLARAPFGAGPAVTLLVLGLLPLALGVTEAFTSVLRLPNRLALVFPGPAIALLLLGLMIGPLVTATFLFDGLTLRARVGPLHIGLRRPPVLSLIVLYVFVVVPALPWLHIHTVRLIDGRLPARQSLDALFSDWVVACAPGTAPIQPIIVAVSGGATRAGLWGGAVLDQVLQAQQQGGPALFAVSSVSGGSLGAAGAMTLLNLEKIPCQSRGLPSLRPNGRTPVPLAGDALGPLLGGWLLDDIPRSAFDPIAGLIRLASGRRPNGGDSAEAIEHAFEDLWTAVHQTDARGWQQPYLSLFYADGGGYRAGMPLWFANGTDATTGNRVITTPIAAPEKHGDKTTWPFRGARDFHTLMGGDVSIATAINNTARFPYLEPFGEMLPVAGKAQAGSLVDGGYFENEGLQTALELADWLASQSPSGRLVQPIIVQATGDGEAEVSSSDVMTCSNASDAPFIPGDKHSAWQIFAPIFGLYHVRGGHSAVLLRQAHDQFCEPRKRFFHFYLPSDDGRAIPLNWVLSDSTARVIWKSFTNHQVKNAAELQLLEATLAPAARQIGRNTTGTTNK